MVITSKIINMRIDAFELWCWRTLESPLDFKEIKPVNPKGNQPWIYIGRTDAEADAPIFCPPDAKNWLIEKDPEAGKDRIREEKGTAEDQMAGWHHQLNGHEFEQAPGDSEGQGGWRAAVHGVAKSRTRLSGWTTTTIMRRFDVVRIAKMWHRDMKWEMWEKWFWQIYLTQSCHKL